MANPEKLSLWDRWFNRYKRTIHKRGNEYPIPAWLEMWYQELGYDDRQRLCLQSNGVPQRILMSIVNAQDIEINRIQAEFLYAKGVRT